MFYSLQSTFTWFYEIKKETPRKQIEQLGLRFISFLKLRKLWKKEVKNLAVMDMGF